ncbi:MAG: hypothetical protein D6696_03340 [Acidobacteria bacterium]|nr:MAG: hypothetical protein D6696_03340 [Acidobacteriota bacterium]
MLNWIYFPKSDAPPAVCLDVVGAFNAVIGSIDSATHQLKSNEVLARLRPKLKTIGFAVEKGSTKKDKIFVPVLFGSQGKPEKVFAADAWAAERRMVLEVEAGRAVANNQILKDLFQACMMHRVDYLGIAVRNTYRNSRDFERARVVFETLYASNRLHLPLKGILLIGY